MGDNPTPESLWNEAKFFDWNLYQAVAGTHDTRILSFVDEFDGELIRTTARIRNASVIDGTTIILISPERNELGTGLIVALPDGVPSGMNLSRGDPVSVVGIFNADDISEGACSMVGLVIDE